MAQYEWEVLTWSMGLVGTAIAFLTTNIFKRVNAVVEAQAQHEVKVAENYVTKTELIFMLERIDATMENVASDIRTADERTDKSLRRLHKKIDTKEDKS